MLNGVGLTLKENLDEAGSELQRLTSPKLPPVDFRYSVVVYSQ